jgi:hypothetical protein
MPLTKARRETVHLLKEYLRADEEERTRLLRQIAESLVDARSMFLRHDGTPDWKGRTHPYRVWVRDAFADAGVRAEEQPTIQAAIRYHVSSVLRERLDDETLADYGLIPKSMKERSADRRQEKDALLKALTARDVGGGALMAIATANRVLAQVDTILIDGISPEEARVADQWLAEIERRVRQLRRRLAKRAE